MSAHPADVTMLAKRIAEFIEDGGVDLTLHRVNESKGRGYLPPLEPALAIPAHLMVVGFELDLLRTQGAAKHDITRKAIEYGAFQTSDLAHRLAMQPAVGQFTRHLIRSR